MFAAWAVGGERCILDRGVLYGNCSISLSIASYSWRKRQIWDMQAIGTYRSSPDTTIFSSRNRRRCRRRLDELKRLLRGSLRAVRHGQLSFSTPSPTQLVVQRVCISEGRGRLGDRGQIQEWIFFFRTPLWCHLQNVLPAWEHQTQGPSWPWLLQISDSRLHWASANVMLRRVWLVIARIDELDIYVATIFARRNKYKSERCSE